MDNFYNHNERNNSLQEQGLGIVVHSFL